MTSLPSVAIVILNWNGRHHLEKFLPSIFETAYENCSIIVADNASTDNSVSFLKENYPQIEIIFLSKNFGFAKGYNEALKKVNAAYYVLINSDVEVEPHWLHPVIEFMETEETCAACQPKVLAYENKNLFEYAGAAGGWIDAYGYPFARGRVFEKCEEDHAQYNTTQQIFWATGAAMVVKSKVYHQLGGFDEYFFAHQEEIDLCWRMQIAGYKIFCCPASVVYHLGGGTLARGRSKKTFLNYRNNLIMLAKNLSLKEKWWKIPFRIVLDIVSAFKALLSGNAGYLPAVFKAHAAFIYWILLAKKEKLAFKKKPLKSLAGVYKGNIVWAYFVKNKKYFTEIILKES